MRFAYADPPYLGMGSKMYADHPDHAEFDEPEGHIRLLNYLAGSYPDGWAMSASSASLDRILDPRLLSFRVRVASWTKRWVSYKPGVSPAYTWEPVLFGGGRPVERSEPTGRDSLVCDVTRGIGFRGAKPTEFCFWLFEDIFNARPTDEFVDLFPGTRNVSRAWETWCGLRGPMHQNGSSLAAKADATQRALAFGHESPDAADHGDGK